MQNVLSRAYRFARRLAAFCVVAGLGITFAATVMPWVARYNAYLDLLANFQIQYLFLSVGVLALSLGLRMWRPAALAALFVLFLAVRVGVPWPTAKQAYASNANGAKLRVVSANLLFSNARAKPFLRYVAQANPDIIALQELGVGIAKELDEGLRTRYPYAITTPMPRPAGVGIYSKYKLALTPVEALLAKANTKITRQDTWVSRFTIELPGGPIVFYNVHPLPPNPANPKAYRDRQLEVIGNLTASETMPTILAGDLNATPWSSHYGDLIAHAKLISGRDGRGPMPTWPLGGPLARWVPAALQGPARIPIDYILCSSQLHFNDFERGPGIGSDHFPVFAEIAMGTK